MSKVEDKTEIPPTVTPVLNGAVVIKILEEVITATIKDTCGAKLDSKEEISAVVSFGGVVISTSLTGITTSGVITREIDTTSASEVGTPLASKRALSSIVVSKSVDGTAT